MKKRIRIKDIAAKAGVSTGTVDRVLHDRGNVAQNVKEKVLEVMQELGYERNLIASTLAYNRTFKIVTLLPDPKVDPYWNQPQLGIEKAYKAVKHYGVLIQQFHFYQFSAKDFQEKSEEVLQSKPDAILLSPLFLQESIAFLERCNELKIPTALINTNIEHLPALCYMGQDSYQSGLLAGRLLHFTLQENDAAMILNLGPISSNAQHLMDKERGFRAYFSSKPHQKIEVLSSEFEAFEDKESLHAFIQERFREHPNIKGIFLTNSRAYKLVDAIPPELAEKLIIVGFDLIEPNIRYLYDGKIDFLINQKPALQGYLGIFNIVNYFILKKEKELERIQYLPLDIVVSENAAYYLKEEVKFQILV